MALLFALFFGAGVAGFTYAKMSPRVGYGNTQQIWTVTAVAFVIATIFFATFFTLIMHQ
jgi:hypothetical protein